MSDVIPFATERLILFSSQMTALVARSATTSSSSTELANLMALCESDLETSFVNTLRTQPHVTLHQLLLHGPPLSDFVRQDAERIFTRAQATASLWHLRSTRAKTPPPSEPAKEPPKARRFVTHPPNVIKEVKNYLVHKNPTALAGPTQGLIKIREGGANPTRSDVWLCKNCRWCVPNGEDCSMCRSSATRQTNFSRSECFFGPPDEVLFPPDRVCLLCVHRRPPQDCPACFLSLIYTEL